MRAVEIPASVLDEPELAVGFWTRVNRKLHDGSGCWNWIGAKLPNGYGTYTVDGGKTRYAHRIAYTAEVGPIPDGLVIDHACGNRRCVNPDHLRAVTQKQNLEHRIGLQPGNKSGYRGVSWSARHCRWRAKVGRQHIGWFKRVEDAAAAAHEARQRLYTNYEGIDVDVNRTAA